MFFSYSLLLFSVTLNPYRKYARFRLQISATRTIGYIQYIIKKIICPQYFHIFSRNFQPNIRKNCTILRFITKKNHGHFLCPRQYFVFLNSQRIKKATHKIQARRFLFFIRTDNLLHPKIAESLHIACFGTVYKRFERFFVQRL